MAEATVAGVTAELAALEDPRIREVNEKHGDDHGVNLGTLRALAKRLRTQQELARPLWATGDTAAMLPALLICRPKAFERDELDFILRQAHAPLPGSDRHRARRTPRPRNRYRRAPGGAQGLPDAPELHVAVRAVWIAEMVRRQNG